MERDLLQMTLHTRYKLGAVILFVLNSCYLSLAQGSGDRLFDNSFLHQIRIESGENPDVWNSISRDYIIVNMSIDGQRVDSVGLRLRGSTSVYSPQKPLQIDINEFVKGQSFDGLKKFNLRNNFKDSSLQRERLAYEIYRRAGLPSPRTSFAEVYVDDLFRGVYCVTEMIDKTFLNHYFPSDNGSLYKGDFGLAGFNVELKEGTMEAFNSFKTNANSSNLIEYVDLDNYLKHMATDIITGDWDSYAYHRHNFYIYFETKSEKLKFINWDHNYAFSAKPEDRDLYPVGTYPFHYNLIDDPNLKVQYEITMCQLLTYLVDSSFITRMVTDNYNLILSSKNDVEVSSPQEIIEYVANRRQRLIDTLKSIGTSCNDLTYPLDPDDLVINEVVLADRDGRGWIELHNNSNSEITLDKHFYLSDDRNFPKKWSFPEPMAIPPKGYLVVWMDRKMNRPGLHSGFTLNNEGGYISMTYEDLTELQSVQYGEQIGQSGHARIPNGTGEFVIQPPTFQANNNPGSNHD